VHVGRQVAEALQVLHAKGVVHGDVSPGNVLITDDGDAKLTDFGVARAIWSDATVTAGALVAGTPAYLAPEVARGEERTPASDVFSLGATLYAATEGVSPLGDAENPLTAVWRSASGHIAAPSAGPLGPTLARMLQTDADARPDPHEVRRQLAAALNPPPAPRPRRTFARTKTTLVAATVVIVVLGLLVGGVIFAFDRLWHSGPHGRGRPSTQPAQAAPPATLGDHRRADPCALLSVIPLAGFGPGRLVTDYGNFDRCDVLISKNGTDVADASVTLEAGQPPEFDAQAHRESQGPVTVVAEPAQDQACDRFLLLRDDSFVVATAKPVGPGSLDPCAVADAVASYAAQVLDNGPMPQRVESPPTSSLARLDACSLLDGTALARVPGLTGHPATGFGGWSCDWTADTATVSAQVRFDRNSTLTADDGQPIKLAGHSAFVSPEDDGPHTCLVSVVHRAYRNPDGDAMEEIAEVIVDGDEPTATLCSDARTLATAVATRLPGA
jgi:hypothetical protein